MESGGGKKFGKIVLSVIGMIVLGGLLGLTAAITFTGTSFVGEKWLVPYLDSRIEAPDYEQYLGKGAPADDPKPSATLEKELLGFEDEILDAGPQSIKDVVDLCMPSIVSINVKANFQEGAGSGVIISESDDTLYIITNNHVIEDGDEITIKFFDDAEAPAEVIGKKKERDLALCTVKLSNIKPSTREKIKVIAIGDSDELNVGEEVVAIGNALGLGQSVTSGVVSATDRGVETEKGKELSFIQTDAAINPGNSGGALINMKGQLIGINSMKLGDTLVEGMGYAIPISEAMPFANKLMGKDELQALPAEQQSSIDITGVDVTTTRYTEDGVEIPRGVYVYETVAGGAAETAGIQRGDVITEFDGNSVTSMAEINKYLAATKYDTEVTLTVMRFDGTEFVEMQIKVTLQKKNK